MLPCCYSIDLLEQTALVLDSPQKMQTVQCLSDDGRMQSLREKRSITAESLLTYSFAVALAR